MIKRIKIRDFKSIRELDVDLAPVTVLVGRSGTGKSNFVQGIRFLRNILINYQEGINLEGGWARILPALESQPKTEIEAVFDVPGESSSYTYRLQFATATGQPPFIAIEELKLNDKPIFSWARNQRDPGSTGWLTKPNLVSVPRITGLPVLGQFPALQQVVFAFAALSNGVGYYNLPSSVMSGNLPSPNHILKSLPGLADDAGNYREVMRAIIQDFHRPEVRKSILSSLRMINPSVSAVELDSLTQASRVVVGHEFSGRVLDLSLEQESDGFRRFYAHLLALYQIPAKLALLFEEPENAIFPGALSLLADEFKAAPKENRGQVILTTHSPGLLDSFDVDSIRVVDMKDGGTAIGHLAKEQRDAVKDHLMTTGELLTSDYPRIDEPVVAGQQT